MLVIAGLSCATSRERWNDEDDHTAPRPKPVHAAQQPSTPPPVSFVVPPAGDDTQVDDEDVPPNTLSTTAPRTHPRDAPPEDSETPPEQAPKSREIPVIVENAAPLIVVHQGDPDRLRSETGAPLSGADQYGTVAEPAPAESPSPEKKQEEAPPQADSKPSEPPTPEETKPQDATPAPSSPSLFVDVPVPEKEPVRKSRDSKKVKKSRKKPPPKEEDQPANPTVVTIAPDPGASSEPVAKEYPVRERAREPVQTAPDSSPSEVAETEPQPASTPDPGKDNSVPEDNGQSTSERSPLRDPHWIGISITGGVGAFIASGTQPGYLHLPTLAYGGQITISPRFLGAFGLELGFWRTGQTTGTSFDSIASTTNEIAARLVFLPRVGAGFFCGLGLGFVYTWSTAVYNVQSATTGNADAFQPGADGSFIVGWRISYFEMRLDLRTVLSGGLRLDFLPAFSLGVTF
jgi:hypothetical protein